MEPNGENLGDLFNARMGGYLEASEEALDIFSFLVIGAQQCACIQFIHSPRQVVQRTPKACRKTAIQAVNLPDYPSKSTRSRG